MPQALSSIRFWRRGEIQEIDSPTIHETVLEYLRSERGGSSCGTKEGCAEGDCGACTVVIAELANDEQAQNHAPSLKYLAVNSCIRFAYQLDGCAIWTVEDLKSAQGVAGEHPVQQALLSHHASQCGFCTPGFVMSLFALYQQRSGQKIDRDEAVQALSGNLCRCTGYRAILDAAQDFASFPKANENDAAICAQLLALKQRADLGNAARAGATEIAKHPEPIFRPRSLHELLTLRATQTQAQIIAGATDVGLWVTKQHRQFQSVIDITQVAQLRTITLQNDLLSIGAAVRLEQAYAAICDHRPQVSAFARRFAGRPVRESGTLGGNIANGSPIGDSMPLLISLGARIRLMSSARGPREMALEDFYLAYKKTQLASDEVLSHVLIPGPTTREISSIYKLTKRFEDDISAVCLGLSVELSVDGKSITGAKLGVGGVAAIPSRARKTELALIGQSFSLSTFELAKEVLFDEFMPLSDMRASAAYRRLALSNLMLRFWHEQTSQAVTQLDQCRLQALAWNSDQ